MHSRKRIGKVGLTSVGCPSSGAGNMGTDVFKTKVKPFSDSVGDISSF